MKCLDAITCEWPQCACGVQVYPWAAKKHGIERKEWERRFLACVFEKAVNEEGKALTAEAAAEIGRYELEAWPEAGDPHNGPDWLVTLPEEAATEQMSNWLADQEP